MDSSGEWYLVKETDFTPITSPTTGVADTRGCKDDNRSSVSDGNIAVSIKDVVAPAEVIAGVSHSPEGNDMLSEGLHSAAEEPYSDHDAPALPVQSARHPSAAADLLVAREILCDSFECGSALKASCGLETAKPSVEHQLSVAKANRLAPLSHMVDKTAACPELNILVAPVAHPGRLKGDTILKVWRNISWFMQKMDSVQRLMCFTLLVYLLTRPLVIRSDAQYHVLPGLRYSGLKCTAPYLHFLMFGVGPLLRIVENAVLRWCLGGTLDLCELSKKRHVVIHAVVVRFVDWTLVIVRLAFPWLMSVAPDDTKIVGGRFIGVGRKSSRGTREGSVFETEGGREEGTVSNAGRSFIISGLLLALLLDVARVCC